MHILYKIENCIYFDNIYIKTTVWIETKSEYNRNGIISTALVGLLDCNARLGIVKKKVTVY